MEVSGQLITSAAVLYAESCPYPLEKKLDRSQSQSEFSWEESNLFSLAKIEQ